VHPQEVGDVREARPCEVDRCRRILRTRLRGHEVAEVMQLDDLVVGEVADVDLVDRDIANA
jgi:hypothetical protein